MPDPRGGVVRICFDACCLSRLTDDQSQASIREEAIAIEQVLSVIPRGIAEFVSSEALDDEVRRNPSIERRNEAQALLSLTSSSIAVGDEVALRARGLVALGYGPFDALHIAVAEFARVDVMLTTDKRLLARAARNLGSPAFSNPEMSLKSRIDSNAR
jgi:predicted nucleic acid-binding protein